MFRPVRAILKYEELTMGKFKMNFKPKFLFTRTQN
jgi:hypothetical protein